MGLFDSFHWTAVTVVLDVLLVSYLIYRILLFVRGTRAFAVLAGLGVIGLVYVLSSKLSLVTLSLILGSFLNSAILVIVVLFQEDLRRALARVGVMPGFSVHAPETLEVALDDISKAVAELSQRRIGALIVVKRDIGLEEYTEHATRLNAEVSQPLLVSIFHPQSPLHDGAVVIDGARVEFAGAVLPLTASATPAAFGTRHKAALGLSEHTDAVIIVVSEETGNISLVREGRVTRDLNEQSLYNALHRQTVFRQQRRLRKMKRFFWQISSPESVDSSDGGQR